MGNKRHKNMPGRILPPKFENTRPAKHRQRADIIPADGVIMEVNGYENFVVELDNGISIKATPGGNIRLHHILLLAGDRVRVELSAYDLTRGRITYRYNVKKQSNTTT